MKLKDNHILNALAPMPPRTPASHDSALHAMIVPNYAYQACMFSASLEAMRHWLPPVSPSQLKQPEKEPDTNGKQQPEDPE